jgi:uncharacterized membrane protein YphA (DoxX/SURF4 family)
MQNENTVIGSAQTDQSSAKKIATKDSQISNKDYFLDWAFRLGFASVFFINSLTALIKPESFLSLLDQNFLTQAIGHYQIFIYLIAINDFTICALILTGIKKKYVYAWAGVYLAVVTFFKATSIL